MRQRRPREGVWGGIRGGRDRLRRSEADRTFKTSPSVSGPSHPDGKLSIRPRLQVYLSKGNWIQPQKKNSSLCANSLVKIAITPSHPRERQYFSQSSPGFNIQQRNASHTPANVLPTISAPQTAALSRSSNPRAHSLSSSSDAFLPSLSQRKSSVPPPSPPPPPPPCPSPS